MWVLINASSISCTENLFLILCDVAWRKIRVQNGTETWKLLNVRYRSLLVEWKLQTSFKLAVANLFSKVFSRLWIYFIIFNSWSFFTYPFKICVRIQRFDHLTQSGSSAEIFSISKEFITLPLVFESRE